jgi:hypothetical protein
MGTLIQTFPSGGGTAGFDGVLIDVDDLLAGGIQSAADLASNLSANLLRDRALLAVLEVSTAYVAALANGLALGVSVSRPSVTTLSWSYGFTGQFYELRNGSSPLAPLPVPVSGTNSGVGDFSIADIFPSAAKVASGATVSGSGVLIESAPLNRQGAPAHASLSVSGDNRSWFNALFRAIGNDSTNIPTRSATIPSAVTGKTVSSPTNFSLPTAATAATNPTTNISLSNLDIVVGVQFSTSITINMALSDLATQTYDVNSVTS